MHDRGKGSAVAMQMSLGCAAVNLFYVVVFFPLSLFAQKVERQNCVLISQHAKPVSTKQKHRGDLQLFPGVKMGGGSKIALCHHFLMLKTQLRNQL